MPQSEADSAQLLFDAGIEYYRHGDRSAAIESWRGALQLDARLLLENALNIQPASLEMLRELGNLCLQANQHAAAANIYRRAWGLHRDDPETLHNLCLALISMGNVKAAAAELISAAELVAEHDALLRIKAIAAENLGDVAGELECHRRILARNPQDMKSLLRVLAASPDSAERAGVASKLQILVRHTPANAAVWNALARDSYNNEGYERALEILDEGIARTNDASLLLIRALTLPKVALSHEQLAFARDETHKTLDRLTGGEYRIKDLLKSVNKTAFHLAYHGQNDRMLQQKIARAHLAVSPHLQWTAPHVGKRRRSSGRLRIGFISSFLTRHSVGRMFGGFIENLSADHFEKIVIRPAGAIDDFGENLNKSAEGVVILPWNFAEARQVVAALELDVLFYADIGMDPFTYYLAFSRLAPLQMVWFGHPMTSGIATIDYFVTSTLTDGVDSHDHYSEKLVMLSRIPSCFSRVTKDVGHIDREALHLPQSGHLYVCPMTLYKFHPDFDVIISRILDQDRLGKVVLITKDDYWHRGWIARLSSRIPDFQDRMILLPYLPASPFLGLLKNADVLLDTFHVGGANTSFDAFGFGSPIVTRREKYLRGKFTSGMYAQMGLGEFVAASDDAYVEFALRLANDRDFRRTATQEVLARNDVLYSDRGVVSELGERTMELYQQSA